MEFDETNLLEKSQVFCILPWIHFHALPNKKVLPCCMGESAKPVANTDSESIIEMMNTDKYRQLRLNMLNGVKSEECKRCYDTESYGSWSLRRSQNMVRGKTSFDLVQATKEDGTIDKFKLKYLDIRWSNICNFKCRSCGPEFSSLHAQEYADKKWTKEHLKIWFNMDDIVASCNENQALMTQLKPYLKDTEEVYFAGGEALITPEHYELLDFWLKHKKYDIDINYTTNFSVFKYKNKNVIDYWKKFKRVKIFASLDASGSLAEYLRKGTEWDEIEENVKRIRQEVPHVEFSLTPTISIWNVHHFPTFFKQWLHKGYLKPDGELRMNVLTHPWWANVQILPFWYKCKVAPAWIEIRNDKRFSQSIRNGFSTVTMALEVGKHPKQVQCNLDGLREFFEENEKVDQIRNEKLFDTIPALEELYTWMRKNS